MGDMDPPSLDLADGCGGVGVDVRVWVGVVADGHERAAASGFVVKSRAVWCECDAEGTEGVGGGGVGLSQEVESVVVE